jgi:hypothetical protein
MRAPPPGRIELPPANIKEITTSVYERLESLGISPPELMPVARSHPSRSRAFLFSCRGTSKKSAEGPGPASPAERLAKNRRRTSNQMDSLTDESYRAFLSSYARSSSEVENMENSTMSLGLPRSESKWVRTGVEPDLRKTRFCVGGI